MRKSDKKRKENERRRDDDGRSKERYWLIGLLKEQKLRYRLVTHDSLLHRNYSVANNVLMKLEETQAKDAVTEILEW